VPGKILRILFRLPLLLYGARLGWLLGSRFIMLTHTGRVSNLPRQTVLEVLHQNQIRRCFYVLAAYGDCADWVRNILLTPEVTVTIGRKTFAAIASRLNYQDAQKIILLYAQNHPHALRTIDRLFQIGYDGTTESICQMAQTLPVISLLIQPAKEAEMILEGAEIPTNKSSV
tara:strand:+ start:205 stop:720 length:516 start_codon:yes stop_codon:yes gene_type:complete